MTERIITEAERAVAELLFETTLLLLSDKRDAIVERLGSDSKKLKGGQRLILAKRVRILDRECDQFLFMLGETRKEGNNFARRFESIAKAEEIREQALLYILQPSQVKENTAAEQVAGVQT